MSPLLFRFRHSRSDELPWLIELAKRGTFKELTLSPKTLLFRAGWPPDTSMVFTRTNPE